MRAALIILGLTAAAVPVGLFIGSVLFNRHLIAINKES